MLSLARPPPILELDLALRSTTLLTAAGSDTFLVKKFFYGEVQVGPTLFFFYVTLFVMYSNLEGGLIEVLLVLLFKLFKVVVVLSSVAC